MATEDRWHDFAKEKPSEDMEGRDFIVSNGHYEKIATWCGYWENEPFMGDRLCDEVVRWKGYLTPEEEKANEATCKELKAVKQGSVELGEYWVYDSDEVDALLAKKDKEIAELKAKLEDVQATAYAESVDAGMRERRLRRLLWHAIALFCARSCEYFSGIMSHCLIGKEDLYRRCEEKKNKYLHAMNKCRAKAEQYK